MKAGEMIFVFGGAAAIVTWLVFNHENHVTDPEADGVESYFVQNFPEWGIISCRDGEVGGRHFINCRPRESDAPGALFLLEPGKAVAVNGKAIQYTERGRATYMDGRPLPVERLVGGGVDVATVIAELR